MVDWWQLTQGGSKVKQSWEEPVCVTSSEIDSIWERGLMRFTKKKKHWVDSYHYRVLVYTHFQHTFQFILLVKVHVASDDPFKQSWKTMYLQLDMIKFLKFSSLM